MRTQQTLFILLFLFAVINSVQAHKFHKPKHDAQSETKIEHSLRLKLKLNPKQQSHSINLAKYYISKGNISKNIKYFSLARTVISQMFKQHKTSTQGLLIDAYLKQKDHHFHQALISLRKLLSLNTKSSNAWLMKAQVELSSGKVKAANLSCKNLWLLHKPKLAIACQSATLSMMGKAKAGFILLKQNIDFKRKSSNKKYAEKEKLSQNISWPAEVFTDIAVQIGNDTDINKYYKLVIKQHPNNYYLKINYADYLIFKKRYSNANLVLKDRVLTDTVLLRLARIARNKKLVGNQKYLRLAKRRFEHSINYNNSGLVDPGHHRELSYYYLYVKRNNKKAYHHALINWRLQKELFDLRLLLISSIRSNHYKNIKQTVSNKYLNKINDQQIKYALKIYNDK